LKSVIPTILNYEFTTLSPAFEIMPYFSLIVMQLSLISMIKVNVTMLPPFEPNEYLYTNYSHTGKEKWEIFAWACREVMAEAGNMKTSD
jgi:hypothetical protein